MTSMPCSTCGADARGENRIRVRDRSSGRLRVLALCTRCSRAEDAVWRRRFVVVGDVGQRAAA